MNFCWPQEMEQDPARVLAFGNAIVPSAICMPEPDGTKMLPSDWRF